jgi:hypothetical protein
MPKKKEEKKSGRRAKRKSGDFHLNETHYEQLAEHKIFESETRIAKVFGVREKKHGAEFINIKSRSFRPTYRPKFHWDWKFNFGVSLYDALHVNSLIRGLRLLVGKLGWQRVEGTEDIEGLKSLLRDKEETILNLERESEVARADHERLITRLQDQQMQLLKANQKYFEEDLNGFKQLIESTQTGKVSESTLQEFLYNHSWLFGTEYVNAEPQKLRGAHSRFDFYLERFNRTNDIVEIKLLSDPIVNKDDTITAKVTQAIDQIIRYIEGSIAAAHSTVISEEEGMFELRPRGIIIIGNDSSKIARDKLQMWNYQLAHISVWTYNDVSAKGDAILKHLTASTVNTQTKI